MIADLRPPSLQQRIVTGDRGAVQRTTLEARQRLAGFARVQVEQTAQAGTGGTVAANRLMTEVSVVPEVYFDLEVGTPGQANQAEGWTSIEGRPPRLLPGQRYVVRAWSTGIRRPGGEQEPVRLFRDLRLSLRGPGERLAGDGAMAAAPCDVSSELVLVDPDDVVSPRGFLHEFEVVVGADAPAQTVRLELCATDGASQPKAIASMEVRLAGERNPFDAGAYKIVGIGATPPPSSMALLHVNDAGGGKLWLRCFNVSASLEPLETDPFALPEKLMGSFDPATEEPMIIRRAMRRFSQGLPRALLDWLDRLLAAQPDASLLLVDPLDTNIPWELVELRPNDFLGERVRIGRWTPSQFARSSELQLVDPTRAGTAIAYVEPGSIGASEEQALARLAAAEVDSPDAVGTKLASPGLGPVGLVYLGFRGILTYWSDPAELFTCLPNPAAGRIEELDWDAVGQTPAGGPLVIANAHHSAHPRRDAGGVRCGLLPNVLGRVTSSFLGTLGAVCESEAGAIVGEVLPGPDGEAAWHPAERLRNLRSEAAARFRASSSPENALAFLATCTYVYYGHPDLRLMIGPTSGDPEVTHGDR